MRIDGKVFNSPSRGIHKKRLGRIPLFLDLLVTWSLLGRIKATPYATHMTRVLREQVTDRKEWPLSDQSSWTRKRIPTPIPDASPARRIELFIGPRPLTVLALSGEMGTGGAGTGAALDLQMCSRSTGTTLTRPGSIWSASTLVPPEMGSPGGSICASCGRPFRARPLGTVSGWTRSAKFLALAAAWGSAWRTVAAWTSLRRAATAGKKRACRNSWRPC